MKIYLTGLMGSGKSHYGKELAKILNYQFYDLDELIEEKEKTSVSIIFETKGENYFREIEKEILQTTEFSENAIVACGGGTPVDEENLMFMKKTGKVIFLMTPLNVIAERLYPETGLRPLLKNVSKDKLKEHLAQVLEDRLRYYREADLVIDPCVFQPGLLTNYLK